MRVLVIHPHLNVKGGSERLTKILIDGLKVMNYEFKIITSIYDEEWFSQYSKNMEILKTGMKFEDVENKISNIVENYEPDIAIVMVQDPAYCYMVKKVKNIPTLMYIHFPIDEEISEENLRNYEELLRFPTLTPKFLNYPDIVLVNSRRTKLAVEMLWPYRPHVVYPCIDEIFFREDVDEEIIKKKEPLIIYVGRFVSLKRQDLLIHMFITIKEKVKNSRLAILGFVDPRHREYYENVKKTYEELQDKIKDVELVESPNDKKLLQYYRQARVYVHLRIGEHFGMAPVEAMSQGTPIVIRLPTGLAEKFKHEIHGYFAETDYELIKYTIKILKEDNEKYMKMSKRCIEDSKEFIYKNFIENIIKIVKPNKT